MIRVTFLGAAGTVTGSKYLVEFGRRRILVDCGLFQGLKEFRLKNWAPLPVSANSIDTVLLTHAHLDHSGYIPLLVKQGFRGRVLCTPLTIELCKMLLPDSGRLQEEDARYANSHGYSKHSPALPLYSGIDAEKSLSHFSPVESDKKLSLGDDIEATFSPSGHILGASFVKLFYQGTSLFFSGDIGRTQDPLMPPPTFPTSCDYLFLESTYGGQLHETSNGNERLASIIRETFQRGGKVLIPAFAIGRAQTLLHAIYQLKKQNRIPNLPVYLDSPMAIRATEIFSHAHQHLRISPAECQAVCAAVETIETIERSQALDHLNASCIIISAAGMATGGRVLHHLKALAPFPENALLFTGFQADGTRGSAIVGGSPTIKIHGSQVAVRAKVYLLNHFSAHADRDEILSWCQKFPSPPRKTFIVHGEPKASAALKVALETKLSWTCETPRLLSVSDLSTT